MNAKRVDNEYSLKHVQFEVSPRLVDWAVSNDNMESRRKEGKKQEHGEERLKLQRPTHQSPPNTTGILAPKYRN